MRLRVSVWVLAAFVAVVGCGSDDDGGGDGLRLNEMQVVGSHNSYKLLPRDEVFDLIVDVAGSAIAELWEYSHVPLGEQFDSQGVRQIELDVFWDPAGGLYSSPLALQVAQDDPMVMLPGLDLPGFKALHIQDIDFETNCVTFIDCLVDVKAWSDEHPHHAPITILVEAKDSSIPDFGGFEFLVPPPIGGPELDILDGEIRSVFPDSQIITPDSVRGRHDTLEEAILTDGWPTIDSSRGKVLFALDNGGSQRDAYLDGYPSLRGRVLFADSRPGDDHAAFMKRNGAIDSFDDIQALVAAGYIVRTRSDSPEGREARTGDTMRRDIALASGAQFISTDYPVENPDFGTGYVVQMPGGMPARCNPISAREDCAAVDIEDPERL